MLEVNGFNSYEAEGDPELYLDFILENELIEAAKRMKKITQAPEPSIIQELEDQTGVYFIDLRKALAMNPTLSSKKIIKPFIQEKKFQILEVVCDHVPKWFDTDLKALGLNYTVIKLSANEYKVTMKAIS